MTDKLKTWCDRMERMLVEFDMNFDAGEQETVIEELQQRHVGAEQFTIAYTLFTEKMKQQ